MPRDQYLMLPKSFSSSEILTTLQPHEHTLMPHAPLGQHMLHTGVPMLQEDVPVQEIRQQC
jgi:hypothetical protein